MSTRAPNGDRRRAIDEARSGAQRTACTIAHRHSARLADRPTSAPARLFRQRERADPLYDRMS